MPVRIYDISKKLGLENKEVLSKAKELGIVAARVASSSLDKITAEYLEQQLILANPSLVSQGAHPPPTPAPPPPPDEPILLVTAPPEPPPAEELATAESQAEGGPSETATGEAEIAAPAAAEDGTLISPPDQSGPPGETGSKPATPPPPPAPAGPKLGDKVGFIQLKPGGRPSSRPGDARGGTE